MYSLRCSIVSLARPPRVSIEGLSGVDRGAFVPKNCRFLRFCIIGMPGKSCLFIHVHRLRRRRNDRRQNRRIRLRYLRKNFRRRSRLLYSRHVLLPALRLLWQPWLQRWLHLHHLCCCQTHELAWLRGLPCLWCASYGPPEGFFGAYPSPTD